MLKKSLTTDEESFILTLGRAFSLVFDTLPNDFPRQKHFNPTLYHQNSPPLGVFLGKCRSEWAKSGANTSPRVHPFDLLSRRGGVCKFVAATEFSAWQTLVTTCHADKRGAAAQPARQSRLEREAHTHSHTPTMHNELKSFGCWHQSFGPTQRTRSHTYIRKAAQAAQFGSGSNF